MKNFIIKFMISYAAMLGTFCSVFFTYRIVIGEFGAAILGCILSVCALLVVNNFMMELESIKE